MRLLFYFITVHKTLSYMIISGISIDISEVFVILTTDAEIIQVLCVSIAARNNATNKTLLLM